MIITIFPIITDRNAYPGVKVVVRHQLKSGAQSMTKHTVTRLDITHLITAIWRFLLLASYVGYMLVTRAH